MYTLNSAMLPEKAGLFGPQVESFVNTSVFCVSIRFTQALCEKDDTNVPLRYPLKLVPVYTKHT